MKINLLILKGRYRVGGEVYKAGDLLSIEQNKKNVWFVDGLIDEKKAKIINGTQLKLSDKELKEHAELEAKQRKMRSTEADNAARGVTPEILAALAVKESKKA